MLLRVIAQPPQEFKDWTAQQQRSAEDNPQLSGARDVFGSLACVNCHTIRGTPSAGKFGPDLTHLMSRQTIAAGVLVNDTKDLRAWVNNPQDAKPGCFMPSMNLTDQELNQVVSYLQSLK
jgi:cytochrome c oxidase subunit 2